MKSEITSRWYFIFFVSVLAISTYKTFFAFEDYEKWRQPANAICTYTITSVLLLFIWYAIIMEHTKLLILVRIWAILSILAFSMMYFMWIFGDRWILTLAVHLKSYANISAFLIVLIWSKKYIVIKKEPNQDISD